MVANATEGEPASSKDRALVNHAPHLVLDGAALAAAAVGAARSSCASTEPTAGPCGRCARAIAERAAAARPAIELAETPTRYVAGEETALVRYPERR